MSAQIRGDVVVKAKALAAKTGATLYFTHDPAEAVRDADAIYTDVWTSMGQEAETQKRLEVFSPRYQVNSALVSKAKRHAIVLHCLPAHRGQEITDEVADGLHSALWDLAGNRIHAQKAVLVALLVPDYARSISAPKPKLSSSRTALSSRPKPTVAKATTRAKKTTPKRKH